MNIEFPEKKQVGETDEFKSFASEIDYLIDFFQNFSGLIFYNGRVISFITDKKIHIFNTILIDSSVQTLRSIKLCCSIGSFSDANTLIRKLRDDLILYVFILNVINLRKPFLDDEELKFKIDNSVNFAKSILDLRFNGILTDDEQAVDAWFNNKISDLPRPIKRKLEFENYMKVLKLNQNISQALENYNLHKYWEILRQRLNDYVHNNGITFPFHNNIAADNEQLTIHLKNINTRTNYISTFFIVLLLMVDSSLISSTDYIDHLDCDLEPPANSQYFVAKFIQDFIDTKVTALHPELKKYIKDNNTHGMNIE